MRELLLVACLALSASLAPGALTAVILPEAGNAYDLDGDGIIDFTTSDERLSPMAIGNNSYSYFFGFSRQQGFAMVTDAPGPTPELVPLMSGAVVDASSSWNEGGLFWNPVIYGGSDGGVLANTGYNGAFNGLRHAWVGFRIFTRRPGLLRCAPFEALRGHPVAGVCAGSQFSTPAWRRHDAAP